jgi:hypothetical protein
VTRPRGPISNEFGTPNDYPFASITATITGGPGNPNDSLAFAKAGSPDSSFVGSRTYLNGSTNPPAAGLTSAVVVVPSVSANIDWNPSGAIPPTPVTVNWELRFYSGATGAVLARQPVTIDVLKRTNPFFPNLSQVGFDSSAAVLSCNLGNVAAPMIQAEAILELNGSPFNYFPAANSVHIRYTIDDVPVGPIVTGPTNIFDRFPLNIDTSNVFGAGPLSDGTHALGAILVDATAGSAATNDLPYYFRCVQKPFFVNNSGQPLAQIYAGPVRIPSPDSGNGPSVRLNSSKLDFLTFPGFTAVAASGGTHNTVVPIPSPQSGFIPPASDPASPLHGLTASQQRDSTRWFTEGLGGANPTEYITMPRFFATTDGGVYIANNNLESAQTLEGDYSAAIRHYNFDGQRNDNQTDQISSGIDGHDGTYWVVFEEFGRIVKVSHAGVVSTLAGGTTDRTKLGFSPADGSVTEDQINAVLTQVGTIVSPAFGDLRGINDGCWDLTDPMPGNSLLVANPIDHYVAKITGLVNGPVTMFRIAGQDGGLNGAQVNPGDNGGFVDGRATEAVAGAGPLALFAGPYSVKMADGVRGPDPLGTLYVADYQNSAVRKLPYDPVGKTWPMVTTLFGNQMGVLHFDAAGPINSIVQGAIVSSSPSINISSVTWAAGVLTVVAAAPVVLAGVDPAYGTIAPFWTVTLAGYTTGNVNGNFQVLTVTDPQHFTLAVPTDPGAISGTGNLTFWADDVYLPSAPTPRPLANAYCPLPQRVVINSKGQLVIGHTWFDAVSTVDLAAGTIVYTGQFGCGSPHTRLNSQSSRANPQLNFQISWFQIDVDSGVVGDVSSTGCAGPKDDIIMLDSNGNVEGYYWRVSADGTAINSFLSNDMNRWQPLPVGRQGGGHYAWMVAISRHQGRMLTSGLADSGLASWRIINPAVEFFSDTGQNLNADGAALTRGYSDLLQGTVAGCGDFLSLIPGVFPWGLRPGITSTHGEGLHGQLGLPGHADSIDGVQAMFPTDDALATFIQSGMGGVVPAPEFTGDDLKDIIYTVRRTSIQGSMPGGTPGGGFIPIAPLVQRAPYETDVTAPVISSVVATRTGAGATTIHVTWTTDKPTWGVVAAGFASAHGTGAPYHLFAREAYVAGPNNPSYGTSHSVTIECHQDVLTYVTVVAKDIPGNNAVSAEQTVQAAGGPAISPDGTAIFGNTGGTLRTLYGTWDFGDQYAPPGPDGNVYRYPRLNGREILNITGIENNMLAFRQLVVDKGGQLFGLTFSSIWNVWDDYSFMYDGNYPNAGTTYDPLPPHQVTPPFTPSSDGTTITGGTGSLTSIDGNWSFGAVNGVGWNLMLNGTPVGLAGGTYACDTIELNSHGQVWVRDPGTANWRLWLEQVLTTSPPPTSLPIPIGISMVPSNNTTISHTAPIGTLIAAITVTMSDGSAFAGSYTVGANGNGHVYAAMSGNNLNVSVSPIPDYGTGTSEAISIHATQNGFTIFKLLDVNPT